MPSKKLIFHNLRETYHELGRYEFKIVLNPAFFKTAEDVSLKIVDSDGKTMKHEFNVWGRKVFCEFDIDMSVSDGVSFIQLDGSDSKGKKFSERNSFWVIKP